jgi:sigma-B regulation protein RsbU (phosphoserine phosphatase)
MVLYSNAGHCGQIHFRADKEEFNLLNPTGGLLGIVNHQKFAVENFIMRPGDILCLFTDGILEAMDAKGNLYGTERIQQVLYKNKHKSPTEIAYAVIEDVQKYSIGANYNDDKTIIVIKRDKE